MPLAQQLQCWSHSVSSDRCPWAGLARSTPVTKPNRFGSSRTRLNTCACSSQCQNQPVVCPTLLLPVGVPTVQDAGGCRAGLGSSTTHRRAKSKVQAAEKHSMSCALGCLVLFLVLLDVVLLPCTLFRLTP